MISLCASGPLREERDLEFQQEDAEDSWPPTQVTRWTGRMEGKGEPQETTMTALGDGSLFGAWVHPFHRSKPFQGP